MKFIWRGCVMVVALSAAAPAAAQRVDGPFAGLFSGRRVTDDASDTLDLHGTFAGTYEDDIVPGQSLSQDDRSGFLQNGASGALSGSLAYGHHGDRVDVRSSAYGAYRRYALDIEHAAVPYGGAATVSIKAAQKLRIGIDVDGAYSPFYQLGGLESASDQFMTSAFGRSAFAGRNTSVDAGVNLTATLSPRATLSGGMTGRDARLLDSADPDSTLRSWNGQATFSYRLSRTWGWHAGYGRGQTRLDPMAPAVVTESYDVGIDYGQTLSFARRTALSFSTSTVGIRQAGETNYRLDGNVRLTRGMSRTWSVYTGYSRTTDYLIGIGQPVLSDTVSAGVNGLLAPRVKWTSEAGGSRGSFGFGSRQTYLTSNVSVRIEVAISRTWGWYTQYGYYYDHLPSGIDLFSIPQFTRHTVTTGLSAWIPVVNVQRHPRDPR